MNNNRENQDFESSDRSGELVSPGMTPVASESDKGDFVPLDSPLPRLKNDAHASSGEGPQPKLDGAGTIVGADTAPGCVGESLRSLDSTGLPVAGMVSADDAERGGQSHPVRTPSSDDATEDALSPGVLCGEIPRGRETSASESERGNAAGAAEAAQEIGEGFPDNRAEDYGCAHSQASASDNRDGRSGYEKLNQSAIHDNDGAPVLAAGAPVLSLPGDCAVEREGNWRAIYSAWERMQGEGMTRKEACRVLQISQPTLCRVINTYAKRDFSSLVENCGRKSDWEFLVDGTNGTPDRLKAGLHTPFAAKLMDIYLATIGASGGNVTRARRTAKMATALSCMAEEPECPPELAARLRRGKFPVCLQRFLRTITPEMENRVRGGKHFQLNGITSRRDLTVRFPNGDRAELPAGMKWVFDDMSVNQPFWCQVDGRILFSRQGLYAIDHRSLRWLGKQLVARPREAYRAEDILRFLRFLFELYEGKPDVIVFEQSVWKSRKIRGFKLTAGAVDAAVEEDEFVRPGMAQEEMDGLASGLAAIGVRIIYATSAHGKIIEGGFNYLQDILAIKTRDANNIGRHAGEFELAAKRLRQVRAGSREPGANGFIAAAELSERIDQAFAFINGKTNSRDEVPDQIWVRDVAKRPLQVVQPKDYKVFLPDVRERVIDGGRVVVTVNGQEHDFRAPWMIEMGSGYRVYCRFDASEPTLGAAIYNRECGPANHQGFKLGKFLGIAAWEMPAPSMDVTGDVRGITAQPITVFYGAGAVDQGDTVRKGQSKLVARFYSGIPKPGQPAVRKSEAMDGEGKVQRVETGTGTESHAKDGPSRTGHQDAKDTKRRGLAFPTDAEVLKRRARLARQSDAAQELATLAGE